MAVIYNTTGCLENLIRILNQQNIYDFNTLGDILNFRNEYTHRLKEITRKGQQTLTKNIADLESTLQLELDALRSNLHTRERALKRELTQIQERLNASRTGLARVLFYFQKQALLTRRNTLENSFQMELKQPFAAHYQRITNLKDEIRDKKSRPAHWIERLTRQQAQHQSDAVAVFREHRHLFYGAIGEERAVEEFSKLPDTYVVINNFQLSFGKPVYDKRSGDRIYSIQVDHVVVGPSGLYLVETKNWSKESIHNRDLFSPVQQIKRHNFAMFVFLNDAVSHGNIAGLLDDWGGRKISPKNIILFVNYKPPKEYQYVTLLQSNEVVRYLTRNPTVFSEEEVGAIVRFLT